ncbi:MAG TPA: hypothetical protein VFI22_03145 [Thermomicrobiales bacterium]|nr:hypothetical protein [Thermomicrobiales bacterium]
MHDRTARNAPAPFALPSTAPAPHDPAGNVAVAAPPLGQIVCGEIR